MTPLDELKERKACMESNIKISMAKLQQNPHFESEVGKILIAALEFETHLEDKKHPQRTQYLLKILACSAVLLAVVEQEMKTQSN